MMSLKKFRPLLIATLLLAGVVSGIAWLHLTTSNWGAELANRVQVIANQEAFTSQSTEIKRVIGETTQEREQLNTYILQDEDDTIALLSELDALAKDFAVEFATVDLDIVSRDERFDDLRLVFSVTGRDSNVMSMVTLLESLPYHSNQVSLTYDRGEETTATLTMLLTTRAYDN